jgi:hypothetical protein
MRQNGDDLYEYVIPEVDVLASNRLALIITRLDPDETRDPVGEYWLTLK